MITHIKKQSQMVYLIKKILYNYNGDTMNLFENKKSIGINVMKKLLEESIANLMNSLFKFNSDLTINIDKGKSLIIAYVINYELSRYELYRINNKEIIDELLNNIYTDFYYGKNLNDSQLNIVNMLINSTKEKCKELFDRKSYSAPKYKYVYRLYLELIGIREDIIDKTILNDIIEYSKMWVNNIEGINKTYRIDTSEKEMQKNQTIDIPF